MTDADLQQAIAKELGIYCLCKEPEVRFDEFWRISLPKCGKCKKRRQKPNWVGDSTAALGLLDEFKKWDMSIEKLNDVYLAELSIRDKDHISDWCKTLSRAISEAAYKGLKAKRGK